MSIPRESLFPLKFLRADIQHVRANPDPTIRHANIHIEGRFVQMLTNLLRLLRYLAGSIGVFIWI